MVVETDLLEPFIDEDVPTDRPVEIVDTRNLGPPEPLRKTLETLADLDAETVLLQRNDRAPQHLYPKIKDRGYAYATVETESEVLTAIWDPDVPR